LEFVYQMLPSGPVVIPRGTVTVCEGENIVSCSAVVIRPIFASVPLANQRLPSGPRAVPSGFLMRPSVTKVMVPDGVTRPTLLFHSWVNQRFPSGPVVRCRGLRNSSWSNRVTTPLVVMRPIEEPP